MILDFLENAPRYYNIHPEFKEAFEFLKEKDLLNLKVGKHEIQGDKLFASVSKGMGRSKSEADLEIHKKYIDIQFVISGTDEMGWSPKANCKNPVDKYNSETDLQFFADKPESWINVREAQFAIFFPEDAHLPLISDEIIHKVVVKIKV